MRILKFNTIAFVSAVLGLVQYQNYSYIISNPQLYKQRRSGGNKCTFEK